MTSNAPPPSAGDPAALLRQRSYVVALIFGAVIGVPVAAFAYFFLKTITEGEQFFFTDLPKHLGFHGEPIWWPLLPLVVSGLLVASTIRYLPGTGGHSPADGFKPAGAVPTIELPGILLASLATLCLGVVLGPEAPLIALGSGLGVLAVHLFKRDAPAMATVVIGAAGSFAAISTLLGSPLVGAFLLMEAAGLGGGLLSIVLLPGLLAAGVGSLIFVGLDSWVGFGTFSLAVSPIPHFGTPNGAEFLWAIAIGVVAAIVGTGIHRFALVLRGFVEPKMLLLMPALGLGIGGLAIAFAEGSGKSSSEVLFSGQSALPPLIEQSATWSVGALTLLAVCKSIAYGLSLSSFRGGPTFPGMFIGAAGGIAFSHGPGLPMIAGAAMGIGAMTAVMLRLPLTSVLVTSLFLQADAITLMPLVIVAVVVSYVVSARLTPAPPTSSPAQAAPEEKQAQEGEVPSRAA
jgi:H+/Cl- antiporter ClcA